jgi:hypothetical protein
VELVVVPAILSLEDRELRKPLTDQMKIAEKSGAGDDQRKLSLEAELELDHPSRLDDPRQRHARDGEVVRVAVVWAYELHRRQEIAAVVEDHSPDLNPTPIPIRFGERGR